MEELIIQVLLLQTEETQPLKATVLITQTEDQAAQLLLTELITIAAIIIHPEAIQHQVLHLPVHTTAAEVAEAGDPLAEVEAVEDRTEVAVAEEGNNFILHRI